MQAIFMDFEASSLSEESYPIEVAFSDERGNIESYLIRPEADWVDWCDIAEHNIHGISRELLAKEGLSVEWIVGRMRGKLKNKTVYVDGGKYDEYWAEKLFEFNGNTARLPFRLADFNQLLVNEFGLWTAMNNDILFEIKQRARKQVGKRHRAKADTEYLMAVYREVKMKATGGF